MHFCASNNRARDGPIPASLHFFHRVNQTDTYPPACLPACTDAPTDRPTDPPTHQSLFSSLFFVSSLLFSYLFLSLLFSLLFSFLFFSLALPLSLSLSFSNAPAWLDDSMFLVQQQPGAIQKSSFRLDTGGAARSLMRTLAYLFGKSAAKKPYQSRVQMSAQPQGGLCPWVTRPIGGSEGMDRFG